jgi:MFS family permease
VRAVSWYALALLIGIYTMHSLDRNVMGVVLEPIKRELLLSDKQAGLIASLANAIGFALTSVPLGLLSDRVNRVRLITLLATIWSGLTVLCGFAGSALALFAARFGVGASEAGFSPSALSLLWDYFPRRRRSTAIGLLYTATALGTGASYWVGGYVAGNYGWRAAFFVAGAPGLILALVLFLTLREPRRGAYDPSSEVEIKKASFAELWRYLVRTRSIVYAICGLTLAVMTVASFWAWTVSFLVRTHGMGIKEAGLWLGIASGPLQAIAVAVTGPIADRYTKGRASRVGHIPAIGMLAAIPSGMLVLFSPNNTLAIVGVMLFGTSMGVWIAQAFGTPLTLAQPRLRGSVMGVVHLASNLIGTGLGPVIAGTISDSLGGEGFSIGWALMCMLLLSIPAAGFMIAASRRRAMAEAGIG